MKDSIKRDTDTHAVILKVQSCHHTEEKDEETRERERKGKSNKQQEHVDFPCQNRYNQYLQKNRRRRRSKIKQKKKNIYIKLFSVK